MLGSKLLPCACIVILVLLITTESKVHAAPEPCGKMMSYYPFKKPEKSLNRPKEDKEIIEKDQKKDLLKKLEKMFEKILRRALRLEESEEVTEKPKGVMEDLLTSYNNFLTRLWSI